MLIQQHTTVSTFAFTSIELAGATVTQWTLVGGVAQWLEQCDSMDCDQGNSISGFVRTYLSN